MQIAEIFYRARIDTQGLNDEVKRAGTQAGNTLSSSFGQRLQQMGPGLSQMSRGVGQVTAGIDRLATRAALAAAGGLTAVVTTAASFEQAWAGVTKTVEGADAALLEQFRQMAREIPVSFEQLASIGEAGGALGIAKDDLLEFTDVVARLSVSTDLSADQAATALGQLGNVLHLSGDDFTDFADSLVALGNAGASTESQIIDMAARFGAAGNSAGLSKEEILALSSAVASMGVEAEAGGSSLSRIFGNVAVAIGTGGDEVQAFTDLLGISADEFQTRWGEDALGTFQDFLTELGKLDQFGQARVLEQAGITGVRDINAVRLMAQNVGFLGDQLTIAQQAQGALNTESDKFFDTAEGQFKILKNIGRDALATIGTELLPVVKDAMKDLADFLKDPATQKALKQFGQDLAGGLRDFLTEVKKADFSSLINTLKGAAEIAKGAFNAFNALPDPIKQLALAAIVANKVSGGAVTQIAKGLGNILTGAFKIAFPKLDIFSRGSPVNPMFVSVVGGLPGVGATGVGSGLLQTAAKWVLGPAAAVLIGAEIAKAINASVIEPARDFETSGIEKVLAGRDASSIQAAIDAIDSQLNTGDLAAQTALVASRLPFIGDALGNAAPVLEAQRAALQALLDEIRGTKPYEGGDPPGDGSGSGGGFGPATVDVTSFDTTLTREFGGKIDKLATNEVLENLNRTSEMGFEGIGTSVEQGVARGTDPIGDIATRILAQAEDPKAPEVMNEIQGHIAGLEEIQQTYLDQGDVKLAAKVQANIDTLNTLIGTTDTHRAVTEQLAADAASFDAAMLTSASTQAGLTQTGNDRLINVSDQVGFVLPKLDTVSGAVSSTLPKLDTANAYLSTIASKTASQLPKGGDTYVYNYGGGGGGALYSQLPKYAEGAWRIPEDQLAYIHKGEMVVPQPVADWMRTGGMAAGGGGDTINVNLLDRMEVRTPRDIGAALTMLNETGHLGRRKAAN